MRTTFMRFGWLVFFSAFLLSFSSWPGSVHTAAAQNSSSRVIVELNLPFQVEGAMGAQAVQDQRVAIQQAQQNLLNSLAGYNAQVAATFQFLPYLTLEVDSAAYERLASSSLVKSLSPDLVARPLLDKSVPRIGGTAAWGMGYTGSGQTVVVIDSGVQSNHSFLTGKVVYEACYSRNDSGYTSLCPGGATSVVGVTGAAAPCTISDLCKHGTHVAGIATGKGSSFSGVAKDANIIAMQVFHGVNNSDVCGAAGTPCILSTETEVALALERVYAIRGSYTIASVNLSLGGGQFGGYCDNSVPLYRDAINQLRAVGIPTVAGSGNEHEISSIYAPACISSAISVGATYDDSDEIWDDLGFGCLPFGGSNSASILKLLAPGANINSSVPGPSSPFESLTGTSMATPHVSGALALIRQAVPAASIEKMLAALQSTGVKVTDPCNDVMTSRIQVDTAITTLLNNTVPTIGPVIINEVQVEGTTQALELRNTGASAIVLTNWHMLIYSGAGAVEKDYTFPAFTLGANAYVVLRRGTGTNNATNLYMGAYTTSWASNGSGAAMLQSVLAPRTLGIDFVRWGSSGLMPPDVGTAVSGENPAGPAAGKNIGRDYDRMDTDDGSDWSSQTPTLGAQNSVIRPPNNDFSSATVVSSIPYTDNLITHTATLQGSEPQLSCVSIGRTVWYRYTAAQSGSIRFETAGSDFDTGMAVYTGTGFGNLTQVGCNDDIIPGTFPQSRVNLNVTAGVTYYIQAGGYGGLSGNLTFKVYVPLNNNDFDNAQVINSLPADFDENTQDATTAGDDPVPTCNTDPVQHSVWFRYTPATTGNVRFETVGSDFDTIISVWRGTRGSLIAVGCHDDINAVGGDFTSRLDRSLTGGTTYYIMISGGAAEDASYGNLVFAASSLSGGALNPPTLTAPDDNAQITNTQPTFSWNAAANATGYEIQIDTTNPPAATAIAVSGLDYTPGSPLQTTTYYWRVRTVGAGSTFSAYSAIRSFTINSASSLNPPTLLTPLDGAQFTSGQPTFSWSTAANAVSYQIRIGTTNPPTTTPIPLAGLNYTSPTPMLQQAYYWQVRSVGAGSTFSAWSTARIFTIVSQPNAAPARNLLVTATPVISWNSVSWAASYQLQVSATTTFTGTLLYDKLLPATTLAYTLNNPLLTDGVYYWRVCSLAANQSTCTSWSPVDSFTLDVP